MGLRFAIALSAFLLLSLPGAHPARAVSLTIEGPTSGPLTSGTGLELVPQAASQVTITIGLDALTSINGYDVTIAWDPAEVSLAADTQLFPGGMPPDTLPFTVAADPMSSAGTRIATISLTAFTTGSLFSLTFDVGALVQDGAPDVRVFVDAATNGAGIAPGSVTLENDSGAGLDLAPAAVPEPASAALALSGLTFFFARRRRIGRPGARAPCLFLCLTAILAVLLASPSLAADATTPDADGDLVNDFCDNCSQLPNRDQRNTDREAEVDGGLTPAGNLCDCDLDNDGDCDADDFGAFQFDFSKGTDSGIGSDHDGSGRVNITDFNMFLEAAADAAPGPAAAAAKVVDGRDSGGTCSGDCVEGACWDTRVPDPITRSDGCSVEPESLPGFPADGNVNNPTDEVVSALSGGTLRCPNAAFGTFAKPGAVCGVDVDLSVCGAAAAGLPCGAGGFCRLSPTRTCAGDSDCTTPGTRCIAERCAPDPALPCKIDDDCGTGFACTTPFCGDVENPLVCEKHDTQGCGYRAKQVNNQFRRDLFAVCHALTGVERQHCYNVCLTFAVAYATFIDAQGPDDGVWSQGDLSLQADSCKCCQGPGPGGGPPPVCGDGTCDASAENCTLGSCPEDCGTCELGDRCKLDVDCPGLACLPTGRCGRLPARSLCQGNGMCTSGQCVAGICVERCGDSACDGDEACGAEDFLLECNTDCGLCAPGQGCLADADCANQACNFGQCNFQPLPGGSLCSTNNACLSGACNFGVCLDAPLTNGSLCSTNNACTSGICNLGVCIAGNLPALSPCSTDAACRNGSCPAGLCEQICGDGFCDGTELCGNANAGLECNADCAKCPNGTLCTANADCAGGACNFGFCTTAGSVGVGGACTTAAACSNNICQIGCCGKPFTAACASNSECCSNSCVTDIFGSKSCALFASASQPGSSETGSTETGKKKKSGSKKAKPAKGEKKP